MSTTVGSFTPPARSVPPIRDPRPIDQRTEGSRTWRDDVEEALKARRVGAQLREGKPKSFRPVVKKIDAPASHSAVISIDHARRFGLPAESPELESKEWQLLWSLWIRYFSMGCWPRGNRAIYEDELASHVG